MIKADRDIPLDLLAIKTEGAGEAALGLGTFTPWADAGEEIYLTYEQEERLRTQPHDPGIEIEGKGPFTHEKREDLKSGISNVIGRVPTGEAVVIKYNRKRGFWPRLAARALGEHADYPGRLLVTDELPDFYK